VSSGWEGGMWGNLACNGWVRGVKGQYHELAPQCDVSTTHGGHALVQTSYRGVQPKGHAVGRNLHTNEACTRRGTRIPSAALRVVSK